jgi:hypothetical protein
MSKVVLGVAQVVGIVVLAFVAIGVLAGALQVVVTIAVIAAIPLAGWWLYKNLRSSRPAAATGPAPDRRAELESRAVVDADGRCGWCGSTTRHTDEHGFPTTPLRHHRAEIDAAL